MRCWCFLGLCLFFVSTPAKAADAWLEFPPSDGDPDAPRIVLISGDEEYRSEESCPMLAKILASHHGFHCTVLFAINPESGLIDPNYNANIPGTEALADADLMILATRWRVLPDEQLEPVYDFLKAGKPVIAFRTATHAFKSGDVGGYDWANFGIQVVGENWHSHHGKHKFQGGRSVTVAKNAEHPILNGVDSFYTPTDIYGVVHLDEEKSTLLLRGAVTVALDPSAALLDDEKNDPMMPLAWLKDYELPGGVAGQCFATTCGAAVDFRSESLRRLLVNASLHLTGQPVPQKANVEFVDPFKPSFFGFMPKDYFTKRGLRVEDFGPGKSAQSVPVAGY